MQLHHPFCLSVLLTFFLTIADLNSVRAQTNPAFAHVRFNNLIDITGTPYMVASKRYYDKAYNQKNNFLLFINTNNGENHKVSFPEDADLGKPQEVRIDSLNIHWLVLSARTKNVNNDKGIDWNDPTQLFLVSTDGKQKTQLTVDSFYVQNWEVNHYTGRILVSGYYDANANRKYDRGDVNEIQVFDLRSLKLIFRL